MGNEDENYSAMADVNTQAEEATHTPILNIVNHGHSNIRLKDYDGKSSWKSYIAQFERIGRMNAWENKTDMLWIHLTGDALTFAEELPDASLLAFDELCYHLAHRFGSDRLTNVYKAELLNRRRKPAESLPELGQAIRQLVNYAYPKFNGDAKEEVAMEKFLDTLQPEIRKNIYQQNPTSLNEAVEKGLKFEAWGLVEETKHGVSKSSVRVAAVEGETDEKKQEETEQVRLLKDLQQKVNDLQITRGQRKDVTCYHCGKVGHISRECYARQREGRNKHRNNSQLTCYRCGGRGHKSTECATPETEN